MSFTQRTKRASKVITAGTVGGLVVAAAIKMAFAWAVNVDAQQDNHSVRLTKIETIVPEIKEDVGKIEKSIERIELKQEAMREEQREDTEELKDLIRNGR